VRGEGIERVGGEGERGRMMTREVERVSVSSYVPPHCHVNCPTSPPCSYTIIESTAGSGRGGEAGKA
jgi:hypothetical protein